MTMQETLFMEAAGRHQDMLLLHYSNVDSSIRMHYERGSIIIPLQNDD